MKLRISYLSIFLLLFSALASAQTTEEELKAHPEYTGGVHLNYPGPTGTLTKAPKGYKPFFVNHIGRHGSRYLVWEPQYTESLATLRKADSAGVLTPLGKDVLGRVDEICEEARGRAGELTPLGVQQHRGVAERMYENYPEAFRKGAHIRAMSTQVPRCILSMCAFSERLKELDPTLVIEKTASVKDAGFIATTDKRLYEERKALKPRAKVSEFNREHTHPDRLMSTLFADKAYLDTAVRDTSFMRNLFALAFIQQDCPKPVELMDIFTDEERIDLWKCGNYSFFTGSGPDPVSKGVNRYSQLTLLKHFIDTADEAIENGENAAVLRFSHDSFILPFTTTLMLSDCHAETEDPEEVYKEWCDFKVCPMCANVQMIFFRNKAGDVIVKFLHNENEVGIPAETDIYPYYHWKDVKAFYQKEYDLY